MEYLFQVNANCPTDFTPLLFSHDIQGENPETLLRTFGYAELHFPISIYAMVGITKLESATLPLRGQRWVTVLTRV